MTAIPQDARSPIQQSRWVHAKNTGDETIPAHGVCEVFVNDVDKDNGVDTLEVKRPTANGVPECVINSLVPIEPGGYGWVTRDFPAYASGIDLVVGDMAGSKKDSFDLTKGFPGFLVVGDGPDATSSGSPLEAAYYRVVEMWEPLARATIEWDLSCDDEKATLSASWVSRTDLAIADARNIYKLKAGAGTQVALQWDGKGKDENDE